jgi:acetyl esterase
VSPAEYTDSLSGKETTVSNTLTTPAPRPAVHAVTTGETTPPTSQSRAQDKHHKNNGKMRTVDAIAPLDVEDLTIPGGPAGQTWLRIIRPDARQDKRTQRSVRSHPAEATNLPVVLYAHGDKAAYGNTRIRRLATKLASDLQAAVVVVDYSLAPSARFPVAIEENYAAAVWLAEHGNDHGLDGTRIAIVADPASAAMADELMLMADERGGLALAANVLLAPRATAVLRAALAA